MIQVRVLVADTGDITIITDALLSHIARRCDLKVGDLLHADVPQFPPAGWWAPWAVTKATKWTLRDAARAEGDLVVAAGTVTPEEMQDEELFTGE